MNIDLWYSNHVSLYLLAKSGIDPEHLVELVEFITTKCDRLHFVGFMTIGAYGYDVSLGPNPDFLKLLEVRETFCKKANVDQTTIELSMGMSCDYEHAVSRRFIAISFYFSRPIFISFPDSSWQYFCSCRHRHFWP